MSNRCSRCAYKLDKSTKKSFVHNLPAPYLFRCFLNIPPDKIKNSLIPPENLIHIGCAFSWADSPEGFKFWSEVSNKNLVEIPYLSLKDVPLHKITNLITFFQTLYTYNEHTELYQKT